MLTAMRRHCAIRSFDSWLWVGSADSCAVAAMGSFIGSRRSKELARLLGFFNQIGQLPADQPRKAGVNDSGADRKPFVGDGVGSDDKGSVADGNCQGVLQVRTRPPIRVKLNDEKLGIDGLPDGDKEHVFLGVAHHEFVELGFCSRHRPTGSY